LNSPFMLIMIIWEPHHPGKKFFMTIVKTIQSDPRFCIFKIDAPLNLKGHDWSVWGSEFRRAGGIDFELPIL